MSAVISDCGQYRYMLTRPGDLTATRAPAVFCMLNASTADASLNDPTSTRCGGFARLWGCDGFIIINAYGLRSTDPDNLWSHVDPVGPDNDMWLSTVAHEYKEIICAWGANAKPDRVKAVVAIFTAAGTRMRCLGVTKSGAPRHPLYVRGDQQLVDWTYGSDSQCADCNGTRKVGGEPCPACAPTDDGPGKDEK